MWAQLSGRPSRWIELETATCIVSSLDCRKGSRDGILRDAEVAGDGGLESGSLCLSRSTLGAGVGGVCGRDCALDCCRRETKLLRNCVGLGSTHACLRATGTCAAAVLADEALQGIGVDTKFGCRGRNYGLHLRPGRTRACHRWAVVTKGRVHLIGGPVEFLGNRGKVNARMARMVLPCDGTRGSGARLGEGGDR